MMTKTSQILLPIFTLIFMVLSGCEEAPKVPPSPVAKLTDIGIYIDSSASMRGYFRHLPQTGTLFQRFMWNHFGYSLRNVLPDEKIFFITFGDEIDEPLELSPSESFLNKFRFNSAEEINSIYSDKNTKLVELFENKILTENRFFVIITDGLPSCPDGSGPDPRITSIIKNKIIDKGFQIWLIGLQTEFSGIIYPETPNKKGQQISFDYSGARPIYFWIGSKELEKGNVLVHQLIKEIRIESKEMLAVELIEFPYVKLPMATLRLSRHDLSGDLITKIKPYPKEDYFEVSVAKRFRGELDIPIEIDWKNQTINYKLTLSFNHPNIWYANESDTWLFHLNSQEIPKNLIIEMTAEPVINGWWENWSTHDDAIRDNAGQTLYLKELVDGLFVPEKKKIVGELKLKFR